MKHYDIICVGAGPTNIFLALSLMNTDKSILIIDKGKNIYSRSCPKLKTGKCVHCSPCNITNGFAGAGTFSDCKLTYSSEIGGNLIDYIGEENFYKYQDEVDKIFTKYGGKEEYSYDEDFANNLQYECSKYGMKLLKGKVRHLGSDGSQKVMKNIYDDLINSSNITIINNCEVVYIDFRNNIVITKEDKYSYSYISVAVGRSGSDWLNKLCTDNNITVKSGDIDIGVRVECPRAITDPVTDKLYEFKIVNYVNDKKCRTFCVNPGGAVVQENYDDIACVNGHSLSDNATLNTNFALLVTSHFTEPFNQPYEYAKSICKLTNMLAGGKPIVQRLIDLKNKKRSTKDRMARLSIIPTLKDAEPGDLRYCLPESILETIVETIDNLNNIMPGINGKDTIFYATEIKRNGNVIDVNEKLSPVNYSNVFFAGDSSGISRGIIQAAIAGMYIAKNI